MAAAICTSLALLLFEAFSLRTLPPLLSSGLLALGANWLVVGRCLTELAPGQDLLPGALLVQLLRGLNGLEPPAEGLGREPCRFRAVEEDDGRVVDPKKNDDHGAGGPID